MKCVTIIGARPQFIKAAPMSSAMINAGLEEVLIHTGQHFDHEMSQVFFDELNIPSPKYNLDVSGGSHAQMTGRMLGAIESKIIEENPNIPSEASFAIKNIQSDSFLVNFVCSNMNLSVDEKYKILNITIHKY